MSASVFAAAPPYPVNLRLHGKAVLVVGAGNVAVRKVGQLLDSGAHVTAIGPLVNDRLRELAAARRPVGSLTIEQRPYRSGEVAAYSLVITCTDEPAINAQVHRDGVAADVWVNSADDPENCEFTLASVVRQGDLQVTISTSGRSPALSMWLRRRFEQEFTFKWAKLLDLLSDVRDEARSTLGTSEIDGWMQAMDEGVPQLVFGGQSDAARTLLRERLGLDRVSA